MVHGPFAVSPQPSAMMRVRVFDTAAALARALALDVARAVARQPDIVLGLPTGRTPIPLYRELGAVPREGLSMGMATILHAERIVLVATGATKARCVERMIEGPVTPRLPASFLQLHRNTEVWLDRAAAGGTA